MGVASHGFSPEAALEEKLGEMVRGPLEEQNVSWVTIAQMLLAWLTGGFVNWFKQQQKLG